MNSYVNSYVNSCVDSYVAGHGPALPGVEAPVLPSKSPAAVLLLRPGTGFAVGMLRSAACEPLRASQESSS
ncbi:MAG: hypothetical protein AAFY29_00340 [Pseudomonadota bacterium]